MIDFEKSIRRLQRRKTIYVIIACILILLNLFVDFISFIKGGFRLYPEDFSSWIGYFLGSHAFIIFALFLFYRVFKIKKRIEHFKKRQFDLVIDSVGMDILKE
jgi:hypothetical protein